MFIFKSTCLFCRERSSSIFLVFHLLHLINHFFLHFHERVNCGFFADYRSQGGLISRNSRQWNMLQDETTLTVSHPSQMLMQQSSNHQLSGFSDSIASASQVTITEPSSSSPSATENTVASHFESTTSSPPPPFIDFLGVGA